MNSPKDSIITLPHENLRKRSQKVSQIDEKIKEIIAHMKASTLDWEENRPHELGVALAAVQINELYRIVIIRKDFDDKDDQDFVTLINPEIIKTEGDLILDHEGCLSVKDIYGLVPRYSKVKVKALDAEGNEIRIKAQDFLARVLQHEIDHTNGILFIDHIKERDTFFRLNKSGELVKVPHEEITHSSILW